MTNRLHKLVLGAGALALLGGLGTTAAHAQTTVTALPVQKPFRIGAGVAFPTEGGSDTVFSVGASYDFGKSTAEKPLLGGLYLDYYGKNSANVYGLGIQGRYLFSPAVNPAQFYAGAGIGVYGTHVSGSSTQTNVGGKAFLGYQLNSGPFAEVAYTLVQENNGVSPNAINLHVGYRF